MSIEDYTPEQLVATQKIAKQSSNMIDILSIFVEDVESGKMSSERLCEHIKEMKSRKDGLIEHFKNTIKD